MAELIAQMHASLENYTLTPKKDGYHLKFFVDLQHGEDILHLNEAIQRLVILTVTRRPRRGAAPTPNLDFVGSDIIGWPLAFQGTDDDG